MTANVDQGMRKLEKEYGMLMKQLSEFESLRREIEVLTAKSSTDLQAKQKLDALQTLLPQRIDDLYSMAKQDLKIIKDAMRQFECYIKN